MLLKALPAPSPTSPGNAFGLGLLVERLAVDASTSGGRPKIWTSSKSLNSPPPKVEQLGRGRVGQLDRVEHH